MPQLPQTQMLHIPSQKQPASTLEFKNFDSILQKNSVVPEKKREKRPHSACSSCACSGLWPAVTRMLSTSQSFQTFLKHNVGNSDSDRWLWSLLSLSYCTCKFKIKWTALYNTINKTRYLTIYLKLFLPTANCTDQNSTVNICTMLKVQGL